MSTIALHFDFSLLAGVPWDAPERILILERVLRALRPVAKFPGRTSIGIGTLFSSWRDIEQNCNAWLRFLDHAAIQAGSTHPALKREFGGILVITISGPLERLPKSALARLKRPRSLRFLFAAQFTHNAPRGLRNRYLGERTMLIGTFTGVCQFALTGESMFFEEELRPMWARLGIDAAYTSSALCGAYALTHPAMVAS